MIKKIQKKEEEEERATKVSFHSLVSNDNETELIICCCHLRHFMLSSFIHLFLLLFAFLLFFCRHIETRTSTQQQERLRRILKIEANQL